MRVSKSRNLTNNGIIHKSAYRDMTRQKNSGAVLHRVAEKYSLDARVDIIIHKDMKVLEKSRGQIVASKTPDFKQLTRVEQAD